MNDNDLGRLVNLLSYLKKHDDVESELGKAPPREYTSAATDPVQRKLHEAYSSNPDQPFSPEAIDAARTKMSLRYGGDPSDTSSDIPDISDTSDPDTSDAPDRSQKEIWQRLGQVASEYGIDEAKLVELIETYTSPTSSDEGVVDPYKLYHSGGGETGKRGGKFDTVGDSPIESVTAKNSSIEPALHHLIRSIDELPEGAEATYRRMLGKSGMAKSSESILLSLLKRLGT